MSDAGVQTPMSPHYRGVTLPILLLITIIAFESMALSTIMPAVATDLGVGGSYGLAFSLMFTATLLGTVLAAPWVAAAGPGPASWAGQGLFAAGSLVAGLAPTYPVLLLGRLLAGLGCGLAIVAVYVIIGAAFPADLRPRVFAWVSAAWILPSVIGPLLAALLTEHVGWRSVFLVVAPALLATAAGTGRAPRSVSTPERDGPARPGPEERARAFRAATLGTVLATGAGLYQWAGPELAPPRPLPVVAALAGVALMLVSLPRVMPVGTLRGHRGLPALLGAKFFLTAAMNGAFAFVPLALVRTRGLSLGQAGAMLMIVSLGWSAGAWVQGRPRFLGRAPWLIVRGGGFVALGLAGVCSLTLAAGPTWSIAPLLALVGLGMGLAMSSMSVHTLALAPPAEHAHASSALQLADFLGSALGVATVGAAYAGLAVAAGADPTATAPYVVIYAACTCSALASALLGRRVGPVPA